MRTKRFFACLTMAAMLVSFASCGDDDKKTDNPTPPDPKPTLSDKALITAFSAKSGDIVITGNIFDKNDLIELPCTPNQLETVMKNATATVTISEKAKISPDPAQARDYTTAEGVKYTVTAENGTTTKTYTVKAIEGETVLSTSKVWQKAFGELGIGNSNFMGHCGIAFSGLNIVTSDGSVLDLDGKKVGTLNTTGMPNGKLVSMSNDDNGVLVATIGLTADGGTPAGADDIATSSVWAWKEGWDKAPTTLYTSDANAARYMSVAGDVNTDAIMTIITAGRGNPTVHHCFVVTGGEWPGQWNPLNVALASNDGCWGQLVSPCSGNPNGHFVIWDSTQPNNGAGIYSRMGIAGEDLTLYGTLKDDGTVEDPADKPLDHTGQTQYGNYSYGHVRGFRLNDRDYVIASTSGWDAAYITIQAADPREVANDPTGGYLLRSQRYPNSAPGVCSAYVYNKTEGCGEVVFMSQDFEIIRFKITQSLL